MNIRIILFTVLLIYVAGAADQTDVRKLLPDTSYIEGVNGEFYSSTNLDEMWPGVWTQSTNGLRVQLFHEFDKDTKQTWVTVSVGSPRFNSGVSYVGPPSGQFAKCELLDSNGVVVPFSKGVTMEGQFQSRISINDLPRWPYGDRGLRNHLAFLSNSPPAGLKEFKIKDVYQIKTEGDYTLTVCSVIYKFETNFEYLDRVDLPCVSTKIHLTPLETKK